MKFSFNSKIKNTALKPLTAAIFIALSNSATSNVLLPLAQTLPPSLLPQPAQSQAIALSKAQLYKLESAWLLVHRQLQAMASNPNWGQLLNLSIGLNKSHLGSAESLRQQWVLGNFNQLPAVEVVDLTQVIMASGSANTKKTKKAIAAYNHTGNRIYLGVNYLQHASSNKLAQAWLEEIGHALDSQFNSTDSLGDEGAIFAQLLTQSLNSPSLDIARIDLTLAQTDNDHAWLPVEDHYKHVELATIVVDQVDCTLVEAVASANNDDANGNGCVNGSNTDTITFNLSTNNQPILPGQQLNITQPLKVIGNGPDVTILDGNNSHRMFSVVDNHLFLEQFTIRNSRNDDIFRGGALLANLSTIAMNAMNFINNTSTNSAGAAGLVNTNFLIVNSLFTDNTARTNGAALLSYADSPTQGTVINSTFVGNRSGGPGSGIYMTGYGDDNTINIINSTFIDNTRTNVNLSGGNTIHGYGYIGGIATANLINTVMDTTSPFNACGGTANFAANVINSLIEDGSCSATLTGDSMIAPLADNGGPTQTALPLTGSPVIDAGTTTATLNQVGGSGTAAFTISEVGFGIDLNNNGSVTDSDVTIDQIAFDQRGQGVARITGSAIDIGATEFGSNFPPIANAGNSQTVDGGTPVTLSAAASTDADGTIASYFWTQSAGAAVTLSGTNTITTSFITPLVSAQPLLFSLLIIDDDGARDISSVTVNLIPPPINFDIDSNGTSDALTDGLLVLRSLFGFTGTTLIGGAVGPNALINTIPDIETELLQAASIIDIDDNGANDPLTDGVLLLRYLFDFRGEVLTNGAIGPGANRSSAEAIQTYIAPFIVNP